MIISHEDSRYASDMMNGAYWYSREIVENIIPKIETDRNWITIRVGEVCMNRSIYFIHNNLNTNIYDFIRRYDDVILVCGIKETVQRVAHLGRAIYLPLSVDARYVEQFKAEKTKGIAYVGRKSKRDKYIFPNGIDYIENLERDKLLSEMAKYRQIYAVGRTAIEGKILGCEILPYDVRFDSDRWKIRDNSEVIPMLQNMIDEIERGN